ncbi:hypothetical protein Slin15195_G086660 [Septoria linicola]|uniref:Uncharacterized protein n=1 Tax=Septoria linicola TaxID=215465 RepID=A0A9Q9B0R1_9PEZI|nr:hypothetical protein Slin14017_G089250 [Septoria linicola]USW55347.1 hypothetical protein Slin15195_G086660 [Septoria linicola]
MYLQPSRPSSLFSNVTFDREVQHQNVSASGIKVMVRIIPHKTAAAKVLDTSRREGEGEVRLSVSSTASSHRGEAISASSSSKKAVQDHAHQDPITSRVLPTAASARPSVTSTQRAKQRQGHIATSKRQDLTTLKSTNLKITERDEELLGHEDGLFCANDIRVDGEEDLDAQASLGPGSELLELNEDNAELDEVFGLISALMPKAE